MAHQFLITAAGPNVTGVVARVAEAIFKCGCSFKDSTMSFLGAHFTLMILVSADSGDVSRCLSDRFAALEADGLRATLMPLGEYADEAEFTMPVPTHEIRVKGPDRSGIVYRTSQMLAAMGVNILAMHTHLEPAGADEPTEFTMQTAVRVPDTVSDDVLRKKLESCAEDMHDMVSVRRLVPAQAR